MPLHFPRDAEDKGIAMIYQEVNMHLNISVAENLFLNDWFGNTASSTGVRCTRRRASAWTRSV